MFDVLEGKKSADAWYPVVLVDATDGFTAETGLEAGTGATAYYAAAGATSWSIYTIGTADWRETGSGVYWLNIGASEFAAEGRVMLQVRATGSRDYLAIVQVRDQLISEMMDDTAAMKAGVTVGTGGIAANAFAASAIGTAAIANGALSARVVAADAVVLIGTGVWNTTIATQCQGAGAAGEAIATVRQVLAGKQIANESDNTQEVYDPDGSTVRLTLTTAYAAPTITRTPS